jgi:gliding motility-associated lipoprotein GldH
MEAILKNKSLFLLLALILTISCNDISEFNDYKIVEDGSWKSGKKISFFFEIKDTILPKNLFINIRSNKEYGFSNRYVTI